MRSVTDLFETMDNSIEIKGSVDFNKIDNVIWIQDIDLSYGNNKVLSNVNVEIEKNKTIALIGASGSGKTTLANVIMGLITPDTGEVLVDGVSLNQYNLDTY